MKAKFPFTTVLSILFIFRESYCYFFHVNCLSINEKQVILLGIICMVLVILWIRISIIKNNKKI